MKKDNSLRIESGIYNKGEISFEDIFLSIKNSHSIEEAGSIHSFVGIVRKTSKNGEPVKNMKIDAYNELANNQIKEICEGIKSKNGIIDVIMVHLKGEFEVSDDLVYVVVASAHREEGFKELRNAVEIYKKEIMVWKKEEFLNGKSEWAH